MDNFEDYYIGRIEQSNIRSSPLFPYSLWNCYDATIRTNGNTNNLVEGWDNGLASQNLNEVKITQLLSGMVISVETNIYKDNNQRLTNIVNTYRRENRAGCLQNIA
ncbi:hypothetical protein RF11_05267 [Thelohanellus kitauei]|uniref:Uncharacterized protein n=1 Tax=Thelohanellus kitauei TaxID=669202 RepID=A0A0C2N1C6_THEKT|nr:hypothetical protein RF11_05267 [Thelohanellus kitauei]